MRYKMHTIQDELEPEPKKSCLEAQTCLENENQDPCFNFYKLIYAL